MKKEAKVSCSKRRRVCVAPASRMGARLLGVRATTRTAPKLSKLLCILPSGNFAGSGAEIGIRFEGSESSTFSLPTESESSSWPPWWSPSSPSSVASAPPSALSPPAPPQVGSGKVFRSLLEKLSLPLGSYHRYRSRSEDIIRGFVVLRSNTRLALCLLFLISQFAILL